MRYVYPVVSRRAGGVSVGINLNPNNACNWRCIYCQVPDLTRGGPPPIDLALLATELDSFLDWVLDGDFMATRVPEGVRQLVDVAFSGNGEPTSAAEFPAAVETVIEVLRRRMPGRQPLLRLITNGSLLDRAAVQDGIARLGAAPGEVWFKVDAVTAGGLARVNSTRSTGEAVARRLRRCADLAPTWVQSCFFQLDGVTPPPGEIDSYVDLLVRHRDGLAGVHLYGLARPSLQKEAPRLARLPESWFAALAERLRDQGLTVRVSP